MSKRPEALPVAEARLDGPEGPGARHGADVLCWDGSLDALGRLRQWRAHGRPLLWRLGVAPGVDADTLRAQACCVGLTEAGEQTGAAPPDETAAAGTWAEAFAAARGTLTLVTRVPAHCEALQGQPLDEASKAALSAELLASAGPLGTFVLDAPDFERALDYQIVVSQSAVTVRSGSPASPSTCPLCGADNACGMAADPQGPVCWCQTVRVTHRVLGLVPKAYGDRTCVCRACVERWGQPPRMV